MAEPRVVILGGGPAGVGGAYQLRRTGKAQVTLLEQATRVGGNAGSFSIGDIHVDFGSHRLHYAVDPEILKDIRRLLGGDLRSRERHGRIRLRGRWLHFPLKPLDLLLRLDRVFAVGAAQDMVRRALPGTPDEGDTFASVLLANLGPTISHHFYFPYARKMWGREPEELSGIQARKRVSAGTFKKLMKRLARPPGGGRFYYMRRGYGQISEAYADAARELGADLRLGWRVTQLRRPERAGAPWVVEAACGDQTQAFEADHVWSTIPVSLVARMIAPEAPPEIIEATRRITYRAMVLVYLELDIDQFTTTDAHYFPEENVRFTRVSEPKNYFGGGVPKGRTVLCAEIPCSVEDGIWSMNDADLGALVVRDLKTAALPLPRPPIGVTVRRLRQAYPIYPMGYEVPLGMIDDWNETLPNFLTYGRQGLFQHDNTHHALYMAYAAVACLDGPDFNRARWNQYREIFKTHVVED